MLIFATLLGLGLRMSRGGFNGVCCWIALSLVLRFVLLFYVLGEFCLRLLFCDYTAV